MAKKPAKKGGGKSGKKSGGSLPSGWKGLLPAEGGIAAYSPLIALALMLAAPSLIPLAGLDWAGFDRGRLWGAMASGIATGITGNPLMIDVVPGIASWFPALKNAAGEFPAALMSGEFSGGVHIVVVALAAGLLTLFPAVKGRMMKYEPPLLMPSLGLLGLALSFRIRIMAPMFNDMLTGLLDSAYFYGFVMFVLFVMVAAQWISGAESGRKYAHWGWSAAIGPIAGFWVGYTMDGWPFFLAAIILFMYCFTIDESVSGIVCGMPLIFAPMAATKILMSGSQSLEYAALRASLMKPDVATAIVCVGAAHVLVMFSMRLLPEGFRRAAFFSGTLAFLLYAMQQTIFG